MNRPTLKIGDVVRLSKRGKAAYAKHKFLFDKMVVQDIQGDSSDGRSKIVCTYFFGTNASKGIFARKHLWSTGYNVLSKTTIAHTQSATQNNNGRMFCMMCNRPTKLVMGLFQSYDLCRNPSCMWYNN